MLQYSPDGNNWFDSDLPAIPARYVRGVSTLQGQNVRAFLAHSPWTNNKPTHEKTDNMDAQNYKLSLFRQTIYDICESRKQIEIQHILADVDKKTVLSRSQQLRDELSASRKEVRALHRQIKSQSILNATEKRRLVEKIQNENVQVQNSLANRNDQLFTVAMNAIAHLKRVRSAAESKKRKKTELENEIAAFINSAESVLNPK